MEVYIMYPTELRDKLLNKINRGKSKEFERFPIEKHIY